MPEVLRVPTSKRPARGGKHQPLHRIGLASGKALQNGAVLGIDRYDLAATELCRPQDERAARDQRLLIGESEPVPRLQRVQRRLESGGAHERIQHHIDFGIGGGGEQRLTA